MQNVIFASIYFTPVNPACRADARTTLKDNPRNWELEAPLENPAVFKRSSDQNRVEPERDETNREFRDSFVRSSIYHRAGLNLHRVKSRGFPCHGQTRETVIGGPSRRKGRTTRFVGNASLRNGERAFGAD